MVSEHDSNNSRTHTGYSASTLFNALADHRRRRILRYLADAEGPVFLDELTDHLAAPDDGPQDRRVITAILLHQHLPKMAEADVISFNRDTHIVEEGPAADHAARHLALVDEREETR